VAHPDADGPAHVSAPEAVLRPPRLEVARVPYVVDEHLEELGGRYGTGGHGSIMRRGGDVVQSLGTSGTSPAPGEIPDIKS
jgi:hypothetical protein